MLSIHRSSIPENTAGHDTMAHSMRTSVKGRAARDWRSADDTAVDGENRWHRSENREAGSEWGYTLLYLRKET